ncbi:microtubule-associated protein futsch-like isoform X1 [Hibiscus syriacus]|uniref:Microtubule-associated protein futsch-like isoform X1 n=1 Tax=Hibiscus syriacus TaxID=106335 RepID=A0A6A2ZZ34_HIBSY|nr:cyclin-dependent protein kinase inhibitor SMR6-like [Hibiscus syriacus]KAE8697138.1 microtubule-associated protein futsch-like isoform X1 [Hibiscus syriacus]
MRVSKKQQQDGVLDSERKKWVIAGIAILTSLKPIKTKPRVKESEEDGEEEEETCSTTPTSKEAKIPEKLQCPLAPRKRRPTLRCNYNGVREFFTPSDLESVFNLHV